MEATARPFKLVKREDLVPLCCHCDQELSEVYCKTKGLGFILGRNVTFFCPHCLTVLGFALAA